jgi:hypothetical protein
MDFASILNLRLKDFSIFKSKDFNLSKQKYKDYLQRHLLDLYYI